MLPLLLVPLMEMSASAVIETTVVRAAIVEAYPTVVTAVTTTYTAVKNSKRLKQLGVVITTGATNAYSYVTTAKDTYFYTMKVGKATGFGVTKNIKTRTATHMRNCEKAGVTCKPLSAELMTKEQAYTKERLLKKQDNIVNTGVPGFKTEAYVVKQTEPWYAEAAQYLSNL